MKRERERQTAAFPGGRGAAETLSDGFASAAHHAASQSPEVGNTMLVNIKLTIATGNPSEKVISASSRKQASHNAVHLQVILTDKPARR